MSVTIKQKFVHTPARKLRLVADVVRGKSTDTATMMLSVMPQRAAKTLLASIKSAVSAAKQQNITGNLTVNAVFVDEGPALKRRILKSRGRATRMEHRMSHITVTVGPAATREKKETK